MSGKKVKKAREKSLAREILDWIVCLFSAVAVAVLIKYFVFTPTLVKQRSMTPTILDGERVAINRLVRTFKIPLFRGDIVTFEMPNAEPIDGKAQYRELTGVANFIKHDLLEIGKVSYIKRIIGVAGDHVQIKNGKVYVNDILQNETYLKHDVETPITGEYHDLIVPEGYVFCMGDNRKGSSDCREFGCIPLGKIEGRVSVRLWPLNRIGKIDK